ncbi:hypothetical protein OAE59_01050 [Synechococcus sp. AH-551-B05]|nr:hypothetical protein [Synechococcus sp. AH-551-B05]MDB4677208.1 hypothetical protein [Synechococcus sp. AH-551-B05]
MTVNESGSTHWSSDDKKGFRWHCGFLRELMALIPRWQYMSEKSKAIVKSVAGTAAVLLIGLVLLRAFFGWIVLAVIIWAGWKVLNRK